jgi:hypothetical protein
VFVLFWSRIRACVQFFVDVDGAVQFVPGLRLLVLVVDAGLRCSSRRVAFIAHAPAVFFSVPVVLFLCALQLLWCFYSLFVYGRVPVSCVEYNLCDNYCCEECGGGLFDFVLHAFLFHPLLFARMFAVVFHDAVFLAHLLFGLVLCALVLSLLLSSSWSCV